MHFEAPSLSVPVAQQQEWAKRVLHAEFLSGICQQGMPMVTAATMDLLRRYVIGHLTLAEFMVLQKQRLKG